MAQGPLVAVGALIAVAGVAVAFVVMGGEPDQALTPGLGTEQPSSVPTASAVAPPVEQGTTTTPLDPFTWKRPEAPVAPGPTQGPTGPSSKLRAKRGTRRDSKDQHAGRLLDSLEQAVTASDGTAIQDYVTKLLAMGDAALPDVIDALHRAGLEQRSLRRQLINALQQFPEPEAAHALMQLALDGTDDRELRKLATLALGKMPAAVATDPLIRLYRAPGDAGNFGFVRAQAASMLGQVGGDKAFATLYEAAEFEEDAAVRRAAVAGLGSNEFEQAGKIEMLLKKVRTDADEGVRRFAMSALGSSTDPRAREELAGLLGEWPDDSTRTTLYYALQKRKDPAAVPALANALQRETNSVMVKRAAGALVNILGKEAKDYLQQSRSRFQSRQDLTTYFDHMLRALDNPQGTGRGELTPPGAPK